MPLERKGCHCDEREEENLPSRHSGKRCHFDERSEEKSFVPPGREGKISRCARNDRGGRNDRTGYSRLGEDMPPCIQAFCCAAGRVKRDASVRGGSGRASGPDPGAKGTMFMVRDPPGSGETDHRYGWGHYRHRASSRVGGNGRGRFPGHGALLSGPRIVSSSRYGALRSGPRAMPFPRVMGQGGDAVDPAEEKPASRATGRHTLSFRRTQ